MEGYFPHLVGASQHVAEACVPIPRRGSSGVGDKSGQRHDTVVLRTLRCHRPAGKEPFVRRIDRFIPWLAVAPAASTADATVSHDASEPVGPSRPPFQCREGPS
jgi:hypothetical protein